MLTVFASWSSAAAPVKTTARDKRPRRPPLELVWHVETVDGQVVEAGRGEEPINPASVVKVATSMWALERLGPDFRFETRVFARGTVDARRGVLSGDLVVQGGGDPDFHAENAFLVADALNRLGIRQVTGALVVSRTFWMGWENGSQGTNPDPVQRGLTMASRLRQALDPRRWSGSTRAAWRDLAPRRGFNPAKPPRVQVLGGIGVDGQRSGELLLVHRSGPLSGSLRRFNSYSNNDIERVGANLGPVEELASLLRVRCDARDEQVSLETSSGLGVNRLSPRLVVRLLREFRDTCRHVGIPVESVLPVAGCGPGTVTRFYPQLAQGANATSVVGKTGTLTSTDGGVSVLAGFVNTRAGDFAFCVAAPNAAGRLRSARVAEERWLVDFIARHGGPMPRACSATVGDSDVDASVIVVGPRAGSAVATQAD
jgi:D-alanyl-D-alanine carboxypeptidase/D-alanyl-D-alanine-endopeptidase (penicillin-binding protein 4)